MSLYLMLKWLHVLSSVVLVGTGFWLGVLHVLREPQQ